MLKLQKKLKMKLRKFSCTKVGIWGIKVLIATKGKAWFMLKKGAKLRAVRRQQTQYLTDLDILKQAKSKDKTLSVNLQSL